MKIDKISIRNNQAWLAIKSEDDEHLGTWHVINPGFVRAIQNEIPKRIKVW